MSDIRETVDPLTGLLNRTAFQKSLFTEFERALRYVRDISVLMIDLDHFKSINDAFGHQRGDEILKEFVSVSKTIIRSSDTMFRYGGDEFVVLLPETGKDQAIHAARRIVDMLEDHTIPGSPEIHITCSIGVASFPDDARSPDDLFKTADFRLLQAKSSGRNQVISSDSSSQPSCLSHMETRLIDREAEIERFNRFITREDSKPVSHLQIATEEGGGLTRFLKELCVVGKLHGFFPFLFQGAKRDQGQHYGSLIKTEAQCRLLRSDFSFGKDPYKQFRRLLTESDHNNFLIIMDDFNLMDRFSTESIVKIFRSPVRGKKLVFVTGVHHDPEEENWKLPLKVHETFRLERMSLGGLKIWLRMLLHQEPPARFTRWLHRETAGLPGAIISALEYLCRREIIQKEKTEFFISNAYRHLRLHDHIGVEPLAPATNLPSDLTEFVGRETELRTLKTMLDTQRFISLIGPGGIGKSRLAIQVAYQRRLNFEHGVYFVPLSSVSHPSFIITSIAESLRFSFHGSQDLDIQLINYLSDKELLLILDNFDHLTSGAGIVERLLSSCSDLKIIVTSRESLHILGETILEIKGLNIPDDDNFARISNFSAVTLFTNAARRSDPGFEITSDNYKAVLLICRMLEGIPLGIELAAPWVRVLSCEEIAAEIQKNLDFLSSSQKNLPQRHRSLRAVFNYSWDLLNEPERCAFSCLSVFRGGFTRDAAKLICDISIDTLIILMNKSLVYRSSSGRFFELEVLRQYAEERLEGNNRQISLKTLHCEYYADFLDSHKMLLQDMRHSEYLKMITLEIDNLRIGWEFCVDRLLWEIIDRYIEPLAFYYDRTGKYQEAVAIFKMATGRTGPAFASGTADLEHARIHAKLLSRLGTFLFSVSKYHEAKVSLEKSLGILEQAGLKKEMAIALNALGGNAARLGNYSEARAFHERSLALRREINDIRGVASSLNNLANVIGSMGDNRTAISLYEDSLEILKSLNDRQGIAAILANLGLAAGALGDRQRERTLLWESYAIRKELNDLPGMASSLDNLGNTEHFLGNYETARKLHEDSLVIRKESGDRWGIALSLLNLANAEKALERRDKSRELLQECIEIYREIGDRSGLALALNNFGELLCLDDHFEDAADYFQESLVLFQSVGDPWGIIVIGVNQAATASHRKDFQTALEEYQAALKVASQIQSVPMILEIFAGFSELLLELPRPDPKTAAELIHIIRNHCAASRDLLKKALVLTQRIDPDLKYEQPMTSSSSNINLDQQMKMVTEYSF